MTPNDSTDDNPFLSLDKKHFPKKRKRAGKAPSQKQAPAAKGQKQSPPPSSQGGQQSSSQMRHKAEDEQEQTLSQEEIFLQAMHGVAPLDKNKGRVVAGVRPQAPKAPGGEKMPRDEDAEIASKLTDLVNGKVEFALEYSDEYIRGHVVGFDSKLMVRLKAGFYSPEAHLDLHGFNSEQAWVSLVQFLKESYMQGRRCLLLIPGRGKNSPEGYGVLRERVQWWLTQDPLKRVVLAFCTALPRHGGAGALYVLLRKSKGKGKINWERYPVDDLGML